MNSINNEQLIDCKKKIEEILTEYNAVLVPVTLISGDKILSRIDLAPAQKNSKDSTEL